MTAVISESSNRNVKSLPTLLTGSQCQRVAGFGCVVWVVKLVDMFLSLLTFYCFARYFELVGPP